MVLLLVVLTGCSVPDVDYVGKHCETGCPASLTCIDGTCQRVESSVYVRGFRFEWATPNSIRWAWALEGPGDELASYELELTSDSQTVRFTSAELAELGGYQLRRSDGFDPVTGVVTPGLAASTVYSAVLRVNDVRGKSWSSVSARGSTDGPRPLQLTVFDDALAPGAFTLPQPPDFRVTPDAGLNGSAALRFRAGGVDFENLRVSGLSLRPDESLTPKRFESAYLDFSIRGKGMPSSSWCEVWLVTNCTPDGCYWRFPAKWVYRPDPAGATYRRVQIPLAAFSRRADGGVGAMTRADLVDATISEVNVAVPFLEASEETWLDGIGFYW